MLPETDHIARTCNASSLGSSGEPTPASFEFRVRDGQWKDVYLSVNWLELLCPGEADLPAKVDVLRTVQRANEHGWPLIKPTAKKVYAVIPVRAIHSASLEEAATTLACRHEPHGDGDPHSGVHPNPGVDHWPATGDGAAQLAVQQYLWSAVCHYEPGMLKPPAGGNGVGKAAAPATP